MPMLKLIQLMRYLFLIVLVLVGSGCSLFHKHQKAESIAVASPAPKVSRLENSKILDQEKLAKGGKILVVPFTPGVDVTADEELDRVSLMIVQGIAGSLDGNPRFSVLNAENADTADFILEGRVIAMSKPGKLQKLVSRGKKHIAVEGKMVDAKSGNMVLHFTDSKESQNKKEPILNLGSAIGQDIGKFLDSSVDGI